MSNTVEQRRKALFARTTDHALIGSLIMLRAKPQTERTAEDRMVHAWAVDEAERRWPEASAAVEAAFDAAGENDADVDYVGVLLANIPGAKGQLLAAGLAELFPPAGDEVDAPAAGERGYMSCPRSCGVDVRKHHSSDLVNGGCDTGPMGVEDMIEWFKARGAGEPGFCTVAELIADHYGKSEDELEAIYADMHGSMA